MKLLAAGASPYVRKVVITASLKGLGSELEVVPRDHAEIDALRARNPLGKIPVLFTADGGILFDSHVICEYLDSLADSPVLFPASGSKRWQTLTLGALGDGMLDAALLLVYEGRYRPEEMRVQSWVEMQQGKIDAGLDELESAPPVWTAHPDYGHITIAAALGYLDFRHGGAWREKHPRLVEWLRKFDAAVPAYSETMPEG